MTTDPSCPTIPEPPETIKRFRCGEIGPDGRTFWAYHKGFKTGEYWVNAERFAQLKARYKRSHKNRIITPEERARKEKYIREWRTRNNAQHRRNAREWHKRRRHADPVFAMQGRVRCLMTKALKSIAEGKRKPSMDMLGLSWGELKEHLEKCFLPGMTWENRGSWEVDHIVPISLAETIQDVEDLSYYTNLRPLWKKDNLAKRDTLPPAELFPRHLLRFLPTRSGLPTDETA